MLSDESIYMKRFLLISFCISILIASGCTQNPSGTVDLSSTAGDPKFSDLTKAEFTGHDTSRENVFTQIELNADGSFIYKELFFDLNGAGEKCTLSGQWSKTSDHNLKLDYSQLNGVANTGTLTWDLYQLEDSHVKFKIDSSLSPKDLVRESLLSDRLLEEVPSESGLTTSNHCLHN